MKLVRDYAILAAGQIAGKVLGFVAFAWLARALDPAGYAAVEYVVGLALLFGALVEGGFGVVAVRHLARTPAELPRLVVQIPWARLVLALLAVPLMVVVAVHLSRAIVSPGLAWLFALGLLAIPWRQEWLLQAQERMGQEASAQLLKATVFAVVVVAWVRSPESVAFAGAAELASTMAMTAYCLYVQHHTIRPLQLRGSLTGLAPLAREAAVAGLGNIVLTLHHFVPLFMSAPIAGVDATAWFAAAARIVASLLVFSYLYHYSLYPSVARVTAKNPERLGALLAASGRVTAWAGVLVGLAITLVAREIVVTAFGAKLAPAAPVLQVLAWVLPVTLFSGHARWGLVARGAQVDLLVAQLYGLGTTIVLGMLMGGRWGATGFAVGAVAGVLVVWLVAHRRASRAGGKPPRLRLVAKPAACAAATVLVVQAMGLSGWWPLLAVLPYALAAFVVDRSLPADLLLLVHAKADVAPAAAAPPPTR
ncbi:MAG: oligosaccharide flippase family protein [Casimicrobiaceae bacterium]